MILVFEVIMQPPKTIFLTFSSETKIMKITHSALLTRQTRNIVHDPWDNEVFFVLPKKQ